ncbi:MAG TPA: tRNA uracil 4-sulfurtransferase ThiI [Coriobacteriia bacterium]|jgi:thiamine biosynthesis protein ThiI
MFERVALVHYHEIGLKGNNRSSFENRLRLNMDSAAEGLTGARAQRISSRLLLPMTDDEGADALLERLAGLPGVSNVADAFVTGRDLGEIEQAALRAVAAAPEGPFAVEARRSNTDFPVSSHDMNVEVGRFLEERTGRGVDLSHPAATVSIEVVQGSAYVYTRRLPGVGGLPVGTSGRVVALLSAGIDSPVAAWRLMKRGAVVVGAHFSGQPHTNDLSSRLASRIGHVLERHEGFGRLCVIPFGDLQREISLASPPGLRVLLYRRLMIRVAEAIGRREGARALVTGESLGQVASQTLENIAAVDGAATVPVLRPLVGMDKNEIIAEARKLGTFEISSEQHDDCCTLFMPRMPATRSSIEQMDEAEAGLDLPRMVAAALAGATHEDFRCPAYRPPSGRVGSGST